MSTFQVIWFLLSVFVGFIAACGMYLVHSYDYRCLIIYDPFYGLDKHSTGYDIDYDVIDLKGIKLTAEQIVKFKHDWKKMHGGLI